MSTRHYKIYVDDRSKEELMFGHLKMGGKNPEGIEINANNQYLTKGGKP